MKKHLIRGSLTLCVAGLLVAGGCTTTQTTQKNIKIAQAMKKEGDVYQNQGNYTAALSRLLEAEKLMPDDAQLQNSLGLAYMGRKRYELAESAFKKALDLDPEYIEAKNNLGASYLRQEKWDTAIAEFTSVLDNLIYPTPHYPLTNIGWAYLGKGDFPQAQTYFQKALAEEPWFVTAVHGMTMVYLKTGQTDRTIAYLHRALHRQPDAAILHADLARAYEKKGDKRQAIKSWKLVLRLVPENSQLARTAQNSLDHLIFQ